MGIRCSLVVNVSSSNPPSTRVSFRESQLFVKPAIYGRELSWKMDRALEAHISSERFAEMILRVRSPSSTARRIRREPVCFSLNSFMVAFRVIRTSPTVFIPEVRKTKRSNSYSLRSVCRAIFNPLQTMPATRRPLSISRCNARFVAESTTCRHGASQFSLLATCRLPPACAATM